MSALLNVFNIGSAGVNVDKNPLQLEDGELPKAQNAIISTDAGTDGSLQKRPGFVKVNASAAAGSIVGALGVPIGIGTAGNDGGLTPAPAVDPTTRLFLVTRRITATTAGWNTSTDLFTTSVTTGGPDGYDTSGTPRVPDYLWPGVLYDGSDSLEKARALWSGRPGVMFQNRFYYAGNDYTYTTTNPTIRMYDGSVDYFLGRVPSRTGTITQAVIDMIVGGDDLIYFTTFDSGTAAGNTMKTRVFSLDPQTGAIVQVGSQFPISPETTRVPFTLVWHVGRLWTRTFGAGISSNSHRVYYIRPGIDTDWTSEIATEAAPAYCPTMYSFQGQLFMGTVADAGTAALMRVRSTQAVYSTSHTVALTQSGAPTMSSFGFANGFGCMAQFGSNLYAAYWNQEGIETNNTGNKYARIYKFDGTTWSVVHAPAANDDSCIPYTQAFVTGGKLFFLSAPARTNVNLLNRILYTSDGSAFTAVTSTLLNDASGGVMGAIAS
jgi:hypothetical protein